MIRIDWCEKRGRAHVDILWSKGDEIDYDMRSAQIVRIDAFSTDAFINAEGEVYRLSLVLPMRDFTGEQEAADMHAADERVAAIPDAIKPTIDNLALVLGQISRANSRS